MSDYQTFSSRIQERYPEGLTGIFAIGATRRTFILEQQRDSELPGQIKDFSAMGDYLIERYFSFCRNYFALGGQHMIITALSYRSFFERGGEYGDKVVQEALRLVGDYSVNFYKTQGVDPYFIGLEPLLHQPLDSPLYQMARQLKTFMSEWEYQEGRHKLLWEIASLPLLAFWQFVANLPAVEHYEIQQQLDSTHDLQELQSLLYKRYSRAVFGTDLPMPHFYLGTNMNGDLKWRSPLPLALSGGEYMRAYYTPYPSLFMTPQAMQRLLEDLTFGKRLHAPNALDYTNLYTSELVSAEYQRIQELATNPESIVGLIRKIGD